MAQNRRAEVRRRRRRSIRIQCPRYVDEQTISSTDSSNYFLSDIGEEATFDYQGTSITISVQSLIETQKLGYGDFGIVNLAEVKEYPDIKMAVKRFCLNQIENDSYDFSICADVQTIRSVGSGLNPHVTKFYAAIIDRVVCELLICMEACGTSMGKFYTTMHAMDKTQHLDLLLKRMINHIVDALLFLKSQNIVHLNIKPSNILLNQNPIIFKLGDSGICGRLTDCNPMMNIAITYLAPENFRPYSEYSRYNIRSDMWALGLSTLEIASNKCPLSKMTTWEIIINIQTWTPELPSNLSTELQELIIWLLKTQPEDRPEKYEDILASHAIQSLPTEITKEEEEMVKIIIEHIPKIDDD